MSDKMRRLKEILAEGFDLGHAGAVLAWDEETYMPPGGSQARGEQISTLQRLSHIRLTSDEVGGLLDDLAGETAKLPFDSDDASLIRVMRRDYERERKLSPELVSEIALATTSALPVWKKARQAADFKLFAPHLEKNVQLSHKVADAIGYEKHPYDALLEREEPGMTTDQLKAILAELKSAIVPLVAAITRNADAVDDRVLFRSYDTAKQLDYSVKVVAKLGYDFARGRQDLTTHPFCISFGPGDVRITTRVNQDFFNECLFGTIHESGHGMYNQGIGPNLHRTPLWSGASPGVHESQSRLWENLIGRSQAFWNHFFPSLQKTFPEPLKGIDEGAFYRAVNRSYPSLIRVEADEVTYNLHILLRVELETELMEGKLKVADVPEAWNARIKEYMGIDVPNDTEGALQDIHWSFMQLGGFAGYTLGNLIGAQLMEKIRVAIPDLDQQVGRGEFSNLLGWLRDNVYQHGRKFTPNELLERVTGRSLTAEAWISYVRKKFGALYSLEALTP